MPIKNRFAELHPEITAWRRDLHEHPEILFDTHRTSALVEEKLRAFGCDEVTPGIGRTGVVAVIKGRKTDSGKVIGLRADMDALPIIEATGKPYASKTHGAMHACGHDGHTAMLLGAAKYLAETRNFDGTAVIIFQPAEEGGGGGREMVEDGMMERWGIQEVYGMHNMPGMPEGTFAIKPGPILASADIFEIEVEGKGGHGAMPHMAVDTALVSSLIVVGLNTLVSRTVNAQAAAVLSVCSIHTDTDAHNVIPHKVQIRGTVRTLDDAVRDDLVPKIKAVAEGTAMAHGAVARVDYVYGVPVTNNTPEQTEFAVQVAEDVAGACDTTIAPLMAGEDFSFMLKARPGAYIMVGNGPGAMVHHPEYDFNDEAIPAGCSWYAGVVEQRMKIA